MRRVRMSFVAYCLLLAGLNCLGRARSDGWRRTVRPHMQRHGAAGAASRDARDSSSQGRRRRADNSFIRAWLPRRTVASLLQPQRLTMWSTLARGMPASPALLATAQEWSSHVLAPSRAAVAATMPRLQGYAAAPAWLASVRASTDPVCTIGRKGHRQSSASCGATSPIWVLYGTSPR